MKKLIGHLFWLLYLSFQYIQFYMLKVAGDKITLFSKTCLHRYLKIKFSSSIFYLLLSILISRPAWSDETDDASSAARFLNQATFGANSKDIAYLQSLPNFESWLDEQFLKPASLQETYLRSRCPSVQKSSCGIDTWVRSRHDKWWINILEKDDQLRQRVAFALSQIMVVSDKSPALSDSQFGVANYYDMLVKNAFASYREILEKVTLHPAMGIYLSMVRNQKANPAKNIRPDENFAREILQLFSIGVHELNIDGSLKLDANGQPIPTYNLDTIKNFARVFTGWNYANIAWKAYSGNADRTVPMVAVESFHDINAKTLLNGEILPAGNNAQQDLEAALNNIFNHPNIAPFISKQLIQRLVTSNPSPDYIERVANVFNDSENPSGRGDLKAVIKAVLLDNEARFGPDFLAQKFGKLREPLLRISHVARAFNASKEDGGEWNAYPGVFVYRLGTDTYRIDGEIGQGLLQSPSVFNFYRTDHSPAGEIRNQKLVAPEFEILNENTMATIANITNALLWAEPENTWISHLNLSPQLALVGNSNALLDHLNVLLLSGQMSTNLRTILYDHLNNSEHWWGNTDLEIRTRKVRDTIALILMSPEYQIQK